jgi:hypothetical protein
VSESKRTPPMTREERLKLIRAPFSCQVIGGRSHGGSGVTDHFFTDGRYRAYTYVDPRVRRDIDKWRQRADDDD